MNKRNLLDMTIGSILTAALIFAIFVLKNVYAVAVIMIVAGTAFCFYCSYLGDMQVNKFRCIGEVAERSIANVLEEPRLEQQMAGGDARLLSELRNHPNYRVLHGPTGDNRT